MPPAAHTAQIPAVCAADAISPFTSSEGRIGLFDRRLHRRGHSQQQYWPQPGDDGGQCHVPLCRLPTPGLAWGIVVIRGTRERVFQCQSSAAVAGIPLSATRISPAFGIWQKLAGAVRTNRTDTRMVWLFDGADGPASFCQSGRGPGPARKTVRQVTTAAMISYYSCLPLIGRRWQ